MIKYLELTAPEKTEFRNVTIISIEVNENDEVAVGDTLFRVKNGETEFDLPATMAGRVVEIIAYADDRISVNTPLLLLETEVESKTTTAPTAVKTANNESTTKQKPIKKKKTSVIEKPKEHTQQSLDLALDNDSTEVTSIKNSDQKLSDEQINNSTSDVPAEKSEQTAEENNIDTSNQKQLMSNIQVTVPDIGTDSAKVVDILVKVGDTVSIEDPLITLESDKASMDVPSTHDGTIDAILVEIDQDISEGNAIVTIQTASAPSKQVEKSTSDVTSSVDTQPTSIPGQATTTVDKADDSAEPSKQTSTAAISSPSGKAHASPSIRRFARELGVNLSQVTGSSRKGRINRNDVKAFVKRILSSGNNIDNAGAQSGSGIPAIPTINFSKFGETESKPLSKIKRLTAANLHRSWLNVPHVTHHDESNINDLESFRKQLNQEYATQDKNIKLSPLAFIVKAVVKALQTYPQFNSSLDASGENLIYKYYYNIGIAVDTPDGLVVPVIKNADKKSVAEIAEEMANLAAKARDKKLKPNDMTGACFSISSLGGIGGTSFTPIVNAPEVAILGVSRSKIQPHWNGSEFVPTTMLPLSLSYDHRVIDGAEAARFARHIAASLEDVRRLTL